MTIKIEWTEASEGCRNCYASMSDLFHPTVPISYINLVVSVINFCDCHTYVVLTKHAGRMRTYFRQLAEWDPDNILHIHKSEDDGFDEYTVSLINECFIAKLENHAPIGNLILGVSAENQKAADERIPLLLDTPAARRIVSCEPLIGPIDLSEYLFDLDGVIVGAETGPNKRPMKIEWAHKILEQCLSVPHVSWLPFFFKKDSNGKRELLGRTWEFFPGEENDECLNPNEYIKRIQNELRGMAP